MKNQQLSSIPIDRIHAAIIPVRGTRVLLDEELARLYEVPTKVLVQAVKRNQDRLPPRLHVSAN